MHTTVYSKVFKGKTFVVYTDFHSMTNLFPQILALLIGNISILTRKISSE